MPSGDENHTELLTVQETAKLLKVPVSWVYGHTRKRSIDPLPGYRLGKYWRFREDELLAWVSRQRTGRQAADLRIRVVPNRLGRGSCSHLDADKILCAVTAQLGWSDPTNYFGHGYVHKSGVAPAQSGVLSAPKLTFAPRATCSASDSSENPMVTQRVTEGVIRVFHATFTLGRSIRKKARPFVNPKSILADG